MAMCICNVSYTGGIQHSQLKPGNVYDVLETRFNSKGEKVFLIDGVEGEHNSKCFEKLQNRGFHYLVGNNTPKIGGCMRLVKHENDTREMMSGIVKRVESSVIKGVYRVYTSRAIYEVTPVR